MRSTDQESAIVVAPRFFTHLIGEADDLPLGGVVWRDTCVVIPPDGTGRVFRNIFTGETVASAPAGDVSVLFVSDILASFPVALLASV